MSGTRINIGWQEPHPQDTMRVWLGTGDPPPDAPTVTFSSDEVWAAGEIRTATMVVPTEDGVKVVTVHSDGSTTVRPIEDFPLVVDHPASPKHADND